MNNNKHTVLSNLSINAVNHAFSTGQIWGSSDGALVRTIYSPVDGLAIADVTMATNDNYNQTVAKAAEAFKTWRNIPAPKRGEIVRQIGDALRKHKDDLG